MAEDDAYDIVLMVDELVTNAIEHGRGPVWLRLRLRSRRGCSIGEVARPQQVASAIAYLASEDASYSTGATLSVDGGYIINGDLPGTAYQRD